MFSKKLNVSAEGKYDATKVSTEGITAEELAKIAKENAKLIDIYTALGANENGLSKLDLALAMDGFAKADADGDGKLSKKELNSYANELNEKYNIDVDRKDLKAFLKSIREYTKNDEKVATKDVIAADNAAKAEAKARAEAEKAEADAKAPAEAVDAKAKAESEAKAKEEAEAEEARIKTPKKYTVQEGETLTGLLKKSLKAQGIKITDENLAKAKEEFVKNNPGALHGPKGKEYLYAGAEVKIAGDLEDKANGKAINDRIIARNEAKAEAKAKDKAKADRLAAYSDMRTKATNIAYDAVVESLGNKNVLHHKALDVHYDNETCRELAEKDCVDFSLNYVGEVHDALLEKLLDAGLLTKSESGDYQGDPAVVTALNTAYDSLYEDLKTNNGNYYYVSTENKGVPFMDYGVRAQVSVHGIEKQFFKRFKANLATNITAAETKTKSATDVEPSTPVDIGTKIDWAAREIEKNKAVEAAKAKEEAIEKQKKDITNNYWSTFGSLPTK